jgi:glycosidase
MKSLVLFLSVFITIYASGQVVTCDPSIPTAGQPVVITFHADRGNKGLMGFTGDIYAHTGVITDKSTSSSDWKYVKAEWTTNIPACKLTKTATDVYTLTISPSIRAFYGVPDGEKIVKMAFVFRSANGSKSGREDGGGDIFATVYAEGLQVSFIEPASRFTFVPGASISIKAEASEADSMTLIVDNMARVRINSASLDTSISVSDHKRHRIIIRALSGNQSAEDTAWYMIPQAAMTQTIPSGLKDGIQYPSDDSAAFTLFAPGKNSVYLIGDFNDWLPDSSYQFFKDGDRFWKKIGQLDPGKEYAFQYIVDENLRIADPYSEKILDPDYDKAIPASVYPGLIQYPYGKTSEIAGVLQPGKPGFDWGEADFTSPEFQNLTIYELLIRDFITTHNIKGVKDKLDYLQGLGINAIELMPFNEFSGDSSWGYNPTFYFAPDKFYGRDSDYKDFIKECHSRGIAVIMDIVLNHSYGESPLVRLYFNPATGKPLNNPWYNTDSPNSAYSWGFDFNHESPATQQFVDRVIEYWLNEYKIDGFRFDFTKGFTNTPGDGSAYDASRIAILKRIYDKIVAVNPKAYMICEHFAPNEEEKQLSDYGMLLWGNCNYNYNEATMGYLENSDFSGVSYLKRGWSMPSLVSYMESHDEERLMYKNLTYGNVNGDYNVKNLPTALERMELAGAFFFTIPGPKMIWQFGELGYDVSIDYNGRVGRKPIHWDYLNSSERLHLYSVWAKLIDLRNHYPVFSTTDFTVSAGANVAVKKIILRHETGDAIVIGNFGLAENSVQPGFTRTGWWHDVFTGDSINITDVNLSVKLAPGEYRIYAVEKMESVINGINDKVTESVIVFPNPARDKIFLKGEATYGKTDIYTITGKRVLSISTISESGFIDISGLSAGMYVLKVVSGHKIYTAKFVKTEN